MLSSHTLTAPATPCDALSLPMPQWPLWLQQLLQLLLRHPAASPQAPASCGLLPAAAQPLTTRPVVMLTRAMHSVCQTLPHSSPLITSICSNRREVCV